MDDALVPGGPAPPDGGPAPPDDALAPGMDVADEPAQMAELVPHAGYVSLTQNFWTQAYSLAHTGLTQKASLHPPLSGHYELHFDDEGFGYLADGAIPLRHVEDFFEGELYQQGDHLVVVYHGTTHERLDVLQRRHQRCTANLTIGAVVRRTAELKMAQFKLPRNGCRLFVCFEDLYKALDLNHKASFWSSVVYKSLKRWEAWLASLNAGATILRAKQYDEAVAGEFDNSRALSWLSVSLNGAVAMLARWAGAIPRKGGLEDDVNRERAHLALEAFLDVLPRRQHLIRFFLDDSLSEECVFPLEQFGVCPVELVMDADRNVALAPLLEAPRQRSVSS